MHKGLWKGCSRHVMGCHATRLTLQSTPSRFVATSPLLRTSLSNSESPRSTRTFYREARGALWRKPAPVVEQRGIRHISWIPKLNTRPVEFNGLSDGQEEAAKSAILEKVMKTRQPTDLMLRCEPTHHPMQMSACFRVY